MFSVGAAQAAVAALVRKSRRVGSIAASQSNLPPSPHSDFRFDPNYDVILCLYTAARTKFFIGFRRSNRPQRPPSERSFGTDLDSAQFFAEHQVTADLIQATGTKNPRLRQVDLASPSRRDRVQLQPIDIP
jgi:hypothetical protein